MESPPFLPRPLSAPPPGAPQKIVSKNHADGHKRSIQKKHAANKNRIGAHHHPSSDRRQNFASTGSQPQSRQSRPANPTIS
jgi:hypothetical protein